MSDADAGRWDERYAERDAVSHPRSSWLDALDVDLPRTGAALDVAAGTGPMACWAAGRGLSALAIDVSARGLELASRCAEATGVRIETRVVDLDTEPLPDGPFALITWFHFIREDLFTASACRLAPGGVVVTEHHTVTNLERNAHPSRRWLVERGAMGRRAREAGLEVVHEHEGWSGERHLARVVGRAPVIGGSA